MSELVIIEVYIQWFRRNLGNWKQISKIAKYYSNIRETSSEVPQGSVLGPILFLIDITDKCNMQLNSKIYTFAVDTALLNSNTNLYTTHSYIKLDLHLIEMWFNANDMIINEDKGKSEFPVKSSIK